MKFAVTEGLTTEKIAGKYLYLDTDFLSKILDDGEALKSFVVLTNRSYIVIEPNIKFEFLRNVYLPEKRMALEKFIDNDELFYRAIDHQTIFSQQRANALTLSYVYAQNGCKSASLVDLFLAGRALIENPRALIVTGNRKDFPSTIFNAIGYLNYEERDGQIRAFAVLEFSKGKYDEAIRRWQQLK